jgi:alpha-tubulin suppressor-like RCC1 family protein
MCWGENSLGELGDGTTETRPRPTVVAGLDGVAQVAVTDGLSCARRADGTVACWGGFVPTPLPQPDTCGGGHRFYPCARHPLAVPELTDVVDLALARGTGCVRRRDGSVWCWGRGDARPGWHPAALGPATALFVDDERSCALHKDGAVVCVGANYDGQLGDGTLENRAQPVAVRGVRAVELALGRLHACARLATGAVWCWGHNYGGELGDGKGGVARPSAGPVVGLLPARALVARHHRTCTISADATVWCWGGNILGALGRDDVGGSATPVQVPGLDHVQALALDIFHACALRADGGLRCWGSDRFGQLGDGATADHRGPVAVRW